MSGHKTFGLQSDVKSAARPNKRRVRCSQRNLAIGNKNTEDAQSQKHSEDDEKHRNVKFNVLVFGILLRRRPQDVHRCFFSQAVGFFISSCALRGGCKVRHKGSDRGIELYELELGHA